MPSKGVSRTGLISIESDEEDAGVPASDAGVPASKEADCVETLAYVPDTQMLFEHMAVEAVEPLQQAIGDIEKASLVRDLYEESFKLEGPPANVGNKEEPPLPMDEETSAAIPKDPPPPVNSLTFNMEEITPQKEASRPMHIFNRVFAQRGEWILFVSVFSYVPQSFVSALYVFCPLNPACPEVLVRSDQLGLKHVACATEEGGQGQKGRKRRAKKGSKGKASKKRAKATASKGAAKATSSKGAAKATASKAAAKATASKGAAKATASKGVDKATASEGVDKATASEGVTKATASEGVTKATSSRKGARAKKASDQANPVEALPCEEIEASAADWEVSAEPQKARKPRKTKSRKHEGPKEADAKAPPNEVDVTAGQKKARQRKVAADEAEQQSKAINADQEELDDSFNWPVTFARRFCPKSEGGIAQAMWKGMVRAFITVILPHIADRSRSKREVGV